MSIRSRLDQLEGAASHVDRSQQLVYRAAAIVGKDPAVYEAWIRIDQQVTALNHAGMSGEAIAMDPSFQVAYAALELAVNRSTAHAEPA